MAGSWATWSCCGGRGKILQDRGPELGLILNPSKCEWSWLNPSCKAACPIKLAGVADEDQVKLVPHEKIEMLGVPLGDDAFVSKHVERKLLGRLEKTIASLTDFEDSQATSFLLRVSFSIVRAVHYMRTTPLAQWKHHAETFDKMIRGAIEKILGTPMSDASYTQACLTPKLGGLGLRKVTEHAEFAYFASRFEARNTAKEPWWASFDGDYDTQSSASFKFDTEVHSKLVES